MGTRSRCRATLAGLSVLVLAGCASASDPSPPTGVDGLVIPTPSPDPGDFVTGVDNPWLPLRFGSTWEYDVTGARPGTRTVTTSEGPDVQGVATTAVLAVTTTPDGRATEVSDLYAQDEAGNVWWFGRLGEWQAGENGARAGLVMAAAPRIGDGYREAYAAGVVDRRAEVADLDDSRDLPAGEFDDLLTIVTTSPLTGAVERAYYARGVGLVAAEKVEGEPRTQLELVAHDEP